LAVERPQAETRLPEWNKTDYRLHLNVAA